MTQDSGKPDSLEENKLPLLISSSLRMTILVLLLLKAISPEVRISEAKLKEVTMRRSPICTLNLHSSQKYQPFLLKESKSLEVLRQEILQDIRIISYQVKQGDSVEKILKERFDITIGHVKYPLALYLTYLLNPDKSDLGKLQIGEYLNLPAELPQADEELMERFVKDPTTVTPYEILLLRNLGMNRLKDLVGQVSVSEDVKENLSVAEDYIAIELEKYNFPEEFDKDLVQKRLADIFYLESYHGRTILISKRGALGPAQLSIHVYGYSQELGEPINPFCLDQAIERMVLYFVTLLKESDYDIELASRKYNRGRLASNEDGMFYLNMLASLPKTIVKR